MEVKPVRPSAVLNFHTGRLRQPLCWKM